MKRKIKQLSIFRRKRELLTKTHAEGTNRQTDNIRMKVFVSHDSSDAEKLKELKGRLEADNIPLFLAHADIESIEANYLDRIKKEISECDIFLLIANRKSRKSSFCNQEIGYALGIKKKMIIATTCAPLWNLISVFLRAISICVLRTYTLPWDLISGHQALKYRDMEDLYPKLRGKLRELKKLPPEVSLPDRQLISDLVIMNLLGSWQQTSVGDKSLASKLADKSVNEFEQNIRACWREPNSPLSFQSDIFQSNVWKIKDRFWLWEKLGKDVFDEDLDRFQECARKALTDKTLYSDFLRKGIAETLALLGNRSEVLENCSIGRGEYIASIVVRRVLDNTDWASLNDVLPLLAEAAPEQFIDAVEEALNQDPCPFKELFAQETGGVGGVNYLTGTLWALEGLAWREEYLARVTVLLGKLASLDPGGIWRNRPNESLATIFLPWFPQTKATWEKQTVAMQTLQRENLEMAWKTLLALLPESKKHSSNTHKPWSASVPEDIKVTGKEYWKQVSVYSQMLINMAKENTNKLIELVKHFDHLPPESLNELLEHIESLSLTEEKRTLLWENLRELISKK